MDNKLMVESFFESEGKSIGDYLLKEIFDKIYTGVIEFNFGMDTVIIDFVNRTVHIEYDFDSKYQATMSILEFVNILVETERVAPLSKEQMKELEEKQKEAEKKGDK